MIKIKNSYFIIFSLIRKKDINYSTIKISLYSEAINNEIYLLPILKKIIRYLYTIKIIFMKIGTKFTRMILLNLFLPIENIEIIQTINSNKDNLLDLNLKNLFKNIQIKI